MKLPCCAFVKFRWGEFRREPRRCSNPATSLLYHKGEHVLLCGQHASMVRAGKSVKYTPLPQEGTTDSDGVYQREPPPTTTY